MRATTRTLAVFFTDDDDDGGAATLLILVVPLPLIPFEEMGAVMVDKRMNSLLVVAFVTK